MTKQKFLSYCSGTYGTAPDYPFEDDFETAVLLSDAPEDVVSFLTNASFEATRSKIKRAKHTEQ